MISADNLLTVYSCYLTGPWGVDRHPDAQLGARFPFAPG
jgi:hypothetical protein